MTESNRKEEGRANDSKSLSTHDCGYAPAEMAEAAASDVSTRAQ